MVLNYQRKKSLFVAFTPFRESAPVLLILRFFFNQTQLCKPSKLMNIILRDLPFLFRVINLRLGITWRHTSALLLSFLRWGISMESECEWKGLKWSYLTLQGHQLISLWANVGAATSVFLHHRLLYVVFCLLLRPFIVLMRQLDNKAFHNLNNSILSIIYRPLILKGSRRK